MQWAYGITTVPERRRDHFYRTLQSLRLAGFDQPRIFVDGVESPHLYMEYGLEITTHYPRIRVVGNWLLSMGELYIRNPSADWYAIFQDDLVTYPGLREYLDRSLREHRDTKGYFNLYTSRTNEPSITGQRKGWEESPILDSHASHTYHGKKQQAGKGALALVFSRQGVATLFQQRHIVEKPLDPHIGWRRIDGGIVESMNMAGWREYVHNPSLVQHTGKVSTIGRENDNQRLALTFMGEDVNINNYMKGISK